MASDNNFKELSYLVYGLGKTGRSVVNFLKKNQIKNYLVWDDKDKKSYKEKRPKNLFKALKESDYIVLSPGINLKKTKNRKKIIKFKDKIITDIDFIFLQKKFFKSVVVTGTNGKSTTCKIIEHLLKKNGYKPLLGGNIGTPILNLKVTKKNFIIIEASSFQLAYSKFICPDFAFLLNITNDHLDWHGNMKNYIESKFKIFKIQKKNQYSFVNKALSKEFKKRSLSGKMLIPDIKTYKEVKSEIKNLYLNLEINDENMTFVYTFSNLLKINRKSFLKSFNDFKGLPHRYEFFLKKKNCIFINDSKATSFQATKFALKSSKNIFWILGGLAKKNDKIVLKDLYENITKSYIIGNNLNFFKKQIQNKVKIHKSIKLKNAIIQILKDIKIFNGVRNVILLSPSAASYDQYLNFEKRGNEFKKLSKYYADKYI